MAIAEKFFVMVWPMTNQKILHAKMGDNITYNLNLNQFQDMALAEKALKAMDAACCGMVPR